MVTEVMGQAQDAGHVTTAHFGSRFPDLAVELDCFFDDKDARFRAFPFEHERGSSAGKRAADDYDVIFEIHRSKRIDFSGSKRNWLHLALNGRRGACSVRRQSTDNHWTR